MSQYQLVNREAPNLISMPGLVCSQNLRESKNSSVVNTKVKSEITTETPEKTPKKLGRPKKIIDSSVESLETPKSTPKSKKLDISKSKVY